MGKNGGVIVLLLLFMIISSRSNARKLGSDPDPIVNQDSPSSSPPPVAKKPSPSPVEVTKPTDDPTSNPSDVGSKGLNDANNKTKSESSSYKGKEKVENQTQPKTFDSKSCNGNSICNDLEKSMIACIQDFDNASNNLTLLVQNERDIDLKVNIAFGASTNNNLQDFKIPGHRTEKINIIFPGDKSRKVILSAGNGDCELQISQTKTTKDPENTLNPKDVNEPVDSPAKPINVDNPTDNSPVQPKDVDNSVKSKEENDPSKPKKSETPVKPKEVEDATEPKTVDNTLKSKDVDDPSKSKDESDPSKSKDVNDPSKSKDVNDQSKSKDVNDQSKSKDVNDLSKSKEVDKPSKSEDINNSSKSKDKNDPTKSKDVNDPTKSKDENNPTKSKDEIKPSKSKDENNPLPKPTPTNVNTPVPQNNILDRLTFYSKQVTPIYGAYFAFLVALLIGFSWALCSFRKRTDNGVPYQELEMGLPESSNAVHVETAEGWDQDWDDDDWDEDKAIRSPGGRVQTKTISSNGLTSRATKKDGWDADWDD